jgi:hypothetical protein
MTATQAQHTPAQWHAHRAFYRDGGYVCQSHSDCGKAPFEVWGETREEAQANANLSASAPELLEALHTLVADLEARELGYMGHPERLPDIVRDVYLPKARAAIAKARGEVAP